MRILVALAATCSLLGCAGPAPDADPSAGGGKADSLGGALLRFSADGSVSRSGTITAGRALRIEYDADRLPDCRGDLGGGRPGWRISGAYSVDGGDAQSFDAPGSFEVPAGRDLALWFTVTNVWGCVAYDSDDGRNYHYAIAGSATHDATLTFGADFTVAQEGTLSAGTRVHVRYADERLPDCRSQANGGGPAWALGLSYQVDGGDTRSVAVAGLNATPDPAFTVPAGRRLALWFSVSDVYGCIAYDSNYGQNYEFPIE